ncbi:HAD-IA family hydrolase [Sinisalibacter aestuarii]|uniref:HAD-IA family hydrolase n=1 Tax=Sinisalibacter aestuarii TaxID=2949426 RepID=UPI003EBEF753
MLQALIFDVDGTLAETEEAHRAAFNRTFEAHDLGWHWSMEDYRWLLKTTGGKERMRAWQATLPPEARRMSDDEIAALHKEKTATYGAILGAGELALRPGVAALIDAARDAGLRIAVATTTNLPNVAALTRCCWNTEPDAVFDVIAAGDEVKAKKPAPDVFELALDRLGLAPGACVAFEDSLNGVHSARGAGLPVVVTPSVYTDDQDFSAAEMVRPSLEGLSVGTLAALLAA